MIKLLKIELKKIKNYRTFWVLVSLYVILLGLVVTGAGSFTFNSNSQNGISSSEINFSSFSIYNYPAVWHNICYVASWFKLLLAVLVIILITNEFEYRTIRQNIIDGLSKADFILSKLCGILLLSVGSTLYVSMLIFFMGVKDATFNASVFQGSSFILGYFIQVFSYLCLAFLIGFLVKRSGLAIGLLLLYSWVIEPIIAYKLPDSVSPYLPLNSIGNLIASPFEKFMGMAADQDFIPFSNMVIPLIYGFLFMLASYAVFRKKDI